MTIKAEMIDELLKDYEKPEDLIGKDGIFKQLQKALIERVMEAEMTYHLGYEKNNNLGKNSGNSRNGKGKKTLKGDFGKMDIKVPRDRNSEFEPKFIEKRQTRFNGFDEKIISMYARGMTVRDIQEHLKDIYNVEVSPDLISDVSEEVILEVIEWQNRALDPLYPIVYFDGIKVNIKDEGHIKKKVVYLALGVNLEGHKDLLGMWIEQTEGAKFWLRIMTELRNRGVQDILIACVDGLKGFPEAINSEFPETEVQLCIVHMVRNSLKFVSYKDRKALVVDLKKIYNSPTAEKAEIELENFTKIWDNKYPLISKSWRNNWSKIIPFFAYPEDIRKAIYTTNAIESLNMTLRKVLKTRASFPTNEAALKLLFLAIRNISRKWSMPIKDWGRALNRFAIVFENRVTDHLHS